MAAFLDNALSGHLSGGRVLTAKAQAKIDEDAWHRPQWFAVYTKSHCERLVNEELIRKHFESFLPIRKVTRQWSDRRKVIEEPLFKSYLFTRIAPADRFRVLNTAGVVTLVGRTRSKPVVVSDAEILALQRMVNEDIPIDPFPYLKEGQKVCIRSGPLKGVEGYIVRKDRHCRLVVSVNQLAQSVSVHIDEADVEVL